MATIFSRRQFGHFAVAPPMLSTVMVNQQTSLRAPKSAEQNPRSHEIALKEISLSRGGHPLFAGINLSIISGDLVWIGGDNGIGKSSLLRLIAGLSRADAGGIYYSRNSLPCKANELIAYQGHQDAFKPTLTAQEALQFWGAVMDLPVNAASLLAAVGLSDRAHVPCGHLSAGQKRRLSLARLILSRKPVWIMDEPTAAMDAEGVELIHGLIAAHLSRGGSATIASHHAPRISGVRTRQLILRAAS